VLERPGIYLREIQTELFEITGANVSCSTICKLLSSVGYTRQKMKFAALQRDQLLRSQFVSDVSMYSKDMLVFLDESGLDKRNTLRKYGYSLRGRPPICCTELSRGRHLSLIASISTAGVNDCQLVEGGVNGDIFYEYVEKILLPHLMTFDGTNPQSIVILDNCAIHHVNETVQMMCSVGALIHFLPPYSPDYNPIEYMFSKLKHTLKAIENDFDPSSDLETLILAALTHVTPQDCQSWIDDCGMYN
jgi:transposase